jgi:translocation and assembly module TamA
VADIELVYQSGPRYRLGAVTFGGDTPLDEDLLQRMVSFKPAPYDSELIAELNNDLQSSGYFEGVRVDAAPTAAVGEEVPVDVRLETRKPRTMGLAWAFRPTSGRAARPTGPATGSTRRATAMVGKPSCRHRGRTSACGTTFRSIRR